MSMKRAAESQGVPPSGQPLPSNPNGGGAIELHQKEQFRVTEFPNSACILGSYLFCSPSSAWLDVHHYVLFQTA